MVNAFFFFFVAILIGNVHTQMHQNAKCLNFNKFSTEIDTILGYYVRLSVCFFKAININKEY